LKEGPDQRDRIQPPKQMFERALLQSRVVVLLPVVIFLASALAAFVYGTTLMISSFLNAIRHPLPVGRNVGLFLLSGDVLLIGTMLVVAAIGFYELFIRPIGAGNPRARLPGWLMTTGLNDLVVRFVPLLVLIALMSFAALLAGVQDGRGILFTGGGLALVIAALMAFLRFGTGGPAKS